MTTTVTSTFPEMGEAECVQLRSQALNDAIRSMPSALNGNGMSTEQIVGRADAFYGFMMNGIRKPRVRQQKPKARARKASRK